MPRWFQIFFFEHLNLSFFFFFFVQFVFILPGRVVTFFSRWVALCFSIIYWTVFVKPLDRPRHKWRFSIWTFQVLLLVSWSGFLPPVAAIQKNGKVTGRYLPRAGPWEGLREHSLSLWLITVFAALHFSFFGCICWFSRVSEADYCK